MTALRRWEASSPGVAFAAVLLMFLLPSASSEVSSPDDEAGPAPRPPGEPADQP